MSVFTLLRFVCISILKYYANLLFRSSSILLETGPIYGWVYKNIERVVVEIMGLTNDFEI